MDSLKAENQLARYSTYSMLRDLAPIIKPYRVKIILATLLRIAGDVLWLYPAYALAKVVTFLATYHPGTSFHPLWVILVLTILAIVIQHILHYICKMFMYVSSEGMGLDLQLASIRHLFLLDIGWHEKENTGNKLKKINRGADSTDRILRMWIDVIVKIAVNLVGTLVVIAHFDHLIAILTLVFMATYYVLSRSFRKQGSRAAIAANRQEENVEGILFESLNNIRTIKVLGMARILMERLRTESGLLYAKVRQRIFWFQTGGYTRGAYAQLFQIGVWALIVYGTLHGRYEVGFLVLFSGYFGKLLDSVTELSNVAQEYVVAKVSIGRVFEMLNEPVRIDTEEGKVAFPEDWKTISFKDVSFSYGDNAVLRNVSFDIKRGEKVGIVGLSGAGKSTLFKLLLKEYESYSGEVLIDDVPLTSIGRQAYFKHAAVVLQDTEVFNFSLKDNITLANTDEADNTELLSKALRVAHVQDFVDRLPEGLDTLIGEKGIRLSGGERQRLGIARAVFKDPQLLLLDEATSHLDIESEEKIRSTLHEFFNTVTAVVIAHRLTTIREMDQIIVIEGGKILEQGSFDELYAKKGRFHELWEKQNL
ncbi:MAG: ATP-binding cassette, subfamily bacterial [Parcubacteria group bacterium]|nr:ATP-binding cassette, subfamily bacterial [Parcubacteria group bacterium]